MSFDPKNINLTDDFKTDVSDIENTKARKLTFISFNDLEPCEMNKEIYHVEPAYIASIREYGLEVPFKVMKNENGKYTIISGNQRYESFKELIKKDENFTYKFNQVPNLNPMTDGIPCIVVQNQMSEKELKLSILDNNKARDLDKLDLYRSVIAAGKLYDENDIKGIRKNEFASLHTNCSARTCADILDNKWLINEINLPEVENEGSYAKWVEKCKAKTEKAVNKPQEPKNDDPILKETAYLKAMNKRYSQFSLNEDDLAGLKSQAIESIKQMVKKYHIELNELKK